ncbi:D-alanyl-D-alanine carboxypeptidase family protein [Parasulfitobacter algicola]|uniref:serine-type D-Ala-D-Ala carboxypeptidase n=1 Tax=Parasulfitobacter algicola TaxID=2614809 RepID=A0ABX2IYR1_9RHOB|nr:D-alanyl-D-alanine carboxypeptidase family protein [Sulfitobacter algicola]NSX56455.1 D-alanyl-D-alanine carboxypeptidase [Sulfitobacter algicola]
MLKQIVSAFAVFFLISQAAFAYETRATAAYVLDQGTGTVLLSKNAEQPLPPASMSKLMTLYMAFEAVSDGRLKIDERLPVSEHAMSYGGSTMFLDTTDRPTVKDLIRGIIVMSGNDACVVIAEALSIDGTEAGFSRMMTARALELGMTDSVFTNSNGWPDPDHRMSMKDLALLADHLIKDYPTYYPLFAEREFQFDGRAPQNTQNRNPLLGLDIGADGLKTGHTREAGYGLVGSAKQGDRRIIFVITGLETTAERAAESRRIVNWAFRQFSEKQVAPSGTVITEAEVWNGAAPTVGLAIDEDLKLLIPLLARDSITSEVVYTGPIEAPITAGTPAGELVIRAEGLPERRISLVAATDIEKGGFLPRMRTVTQVLMRNLAEKQADAPS